MTDDEGGDAFDLNPEALLPRALKGKRVVAAGFQPSIMNLQDLELTFDDGTVLTVHLGQEALEITIEGPGLDLHRGGA